MLEGHIEELRHKPPEGVNPGKQVVHAKADVQVEQPLGHGTHALPERKDPGIHPQLEGNVFDRETIPDLHTIQAVGRGPIQSEQVKSQATQAKVEES